MKNKKANLLFIFYFLNKIDHVMLLYFADISEKKKDIYKIKEKKVKCLPPPLNYKYALNICILNINLLKF